MAAEIIEVERDRTLGGSYGKTRSQTESYRVTVSVENDDDIDNVSDVLASHSMFRRFAEHPYVAGIFAAEVSFENWAEGLFRGNHVLRVTVSYTNDEQQLIQKEDRPPLPENPLDDPLIWHSSYQVEQVPVEKDKDGKAVVNSAGDYFDPPPTRAKAVWTHSVTKNMAVVPLELPTYANAINSDAVTIRGISCEAESVQISGIDIPNPTSRNGISYVPVTIVYRHDKGKGFDLSILDQGYRERINGKQVDIYIEPSEEALARDKNLVAERASVPVQLDGNGRRLANPSFETCVFLDFNVANKMSFDGLPGIA